MTEVEIEAQAEEYVNKNPRAKILYSFEENRILQIKKAFKDGTKWGMEHSIEWHDLRKDPNDFPKYNEEDDEDNFYLVAFRNFHDKKDIVTNQFIWDGNEFLETDYRDIPYLKKEGVLVAWCELPRFKE